MTEIKAALSKLRTVAPVGGNYYSFVHPLHLLWIIYEVHPWFFNIGPEFYEIREQLAQDYEGLGINGRWPVLKVP